MILHHCRNIKKSNKAWLRLPSIRYQSTHENGASEPVMYKEIIDILKPEDGKIFIDMTFGCGGHSKKLLDMNKSIKLVAVDRDPMAIREAQILSQDIAKKSQRLNIKQSVIPIHGKFSTVMKQIHLSGISYDSVDGVIFDLGPSSLQLRDTKRGFTLTREGLLDMRMDTSNEADITAEDVINNMTVEQLTSIFRLLGQDRRALKIANGIVDARLLLGRIKTTRELARIITSNTSRLDLESIDPLNPPGSKIFQALRIFVNNELNELNYALEKIRQFLRPSINKDQPYGVAAVITYNPLEDKIVKKHFTGIDPLEPINNSLTQHSRIRTNVIDVTNSATKSNLWEPIWKHVKIPTDEEMDLNPKCRTAKLRAAIRIT